MPWSLKHVTVTEEPSGDCIMFYGSDHPRQRDYPAGLDLITGARESRAVSPTGRRPGRQKAKLERSKAQEGISAALLDCRLREQGSGWPLELRATPDAGSSPGRGPEFSPGTGLSLEEGSELQIRAGLPGTWISAPCDPGRRTRPSRPGRANCDIMNVCCLQP